MAKQEVQELISLIKDYSKGNRSMERESFDPNHWFRTLFRLYIDGSHTYPGNTPGYQYVERLRERVKNANGSNKKLTSIAIENFMNMLAVEFPGISRSTIQRTLVKNFTPKDLNRLNEDLVEDLKEYYLEENI
jgi:hypothetical protein